MAFIEQKQEKTGEKNHKYIVPVALCCAMLVVFFVISVIHITRLEDSHRFFADSSVCASENESSGEERMDINTVHMDELLLIEGLSRSEAFLILKYRDIYGGYSSIVQLKEIADIDSETYEILSRTLYVDKETYTALHAQSEGFKVNINTADMNELAALPLITKNLARQIVDYREENNGFVSKEEIKEIDGISDEIYDCIVDLIVV